MPFGENLRWLLAKKNVAPKELANFIDVKVNTISNYTNGVSTPNYEILQKIVKFLEVSADEILFRDLPREGLSEKLAPNIAPIVAPNAKKRPLISGPEIVTINQHGKDNIVFVPIKAAAGYLSGYADPEYIGTLPAYRLPGYENGTFRLFEVKGDSMIPTFSEGDRVIGKWVEINDIRDSYVHVVVTKERGAVVKRVLNRLKTDGVLILKSDGNRKLYPDIIVEPSDVVEVWRGSGYMSKNLSGPAELYTRLDDAEGRLAIIENLLKAK